MLEYDDSTGPDFFHNVRDKANNESKLLYIVKYNGELASAKGPYSPDNEIDC